MKAQYLFLLIIFSSFPLSAVEPTRPFSLSDVYNNAEMLQGMRTQRKLQEQEYRIREQQIRANEQPAYQPQQQEQAPAPDNVLLKFNEAIKYRRHRFNDFDEIVFNDSLLITMDMVGLMAESKYAADIAYYLGKNPEITAQISTMTLPHAARRIYDIEAMIINSRGK